MPHLFRNYRRGWLVHCSFSEGGRSRPAPTTVTGNNPAGVDASGYSRFTLLHQQRDNIKIDEAILRIEDFHVVADRAAASSHRFPIKTADPFIQPFADRFACSSPNTSHAASLR